MKEIEILKESIDNSNFENREELLTILKSIESNLKNKKYGLVWEDKPENIKEDLKNNFIYLEEDSEKRIFSSVDKPENILIEGDNLESLMALQYTHKGRVDIIYIDPPYNTGNNDFVYNDNYINKENEWRHSYWLSFMDKRLKLAKELMSEDGVIFISIDDNEFAQLKILCDEIFGFNNYISNIIWNNSVKSQSSQINCVNEYILCYAKNKKILPVWKIQRDSDIINNLYNIVKNDDIETARFNLKKEIATLCDKSSDYSWLKNYNNLSNERKIYYSYDLSVPGKPCERRLINGVVLKPLDNRAWQSESAINNLIETNRVEWKGSRPYGIKYLEESEDSIQNVINDIFTRNGKEELKNIFSTTQIPFSYPKPSKLIKRLLKMPSKKNCIILDFFAGSGTTGQAVIELNNEDGGNRQFILCTNNENNICEEVAYKRLDKIINGYTNIKNKEVKGISSNLRYYRTKKIEKTNNNELDQFNLLDKTLELIQIKENAFKITKSSNYYSLLNNNDKIIGLYSFGFIDSIEIENMLDKLIESDKNDKVAYVPVENVSEIYDYIDNRYLGLIRFEKMPKELIEIYNKLNRN